MLIPCLQYLLKIVFNDGLNSVQLAGRESPAAADNASFDPPAPVAKFVLREPLSGRSIADVPMLIDSGADVTLLPRPSLDALGLDVASGKEYVLTAFDGTTSVSRAVYVHLYFLRRTFRGRFLTTAGDWGILGRDILNHLALFHDGPELKMG